MKRGRKFKPNKFRIVGDFVWIVLTQGQETIIDLADWERVKKHRWCAQRTDRGFRAVTEVDGDTVLLHRFIAAIGDNQVDHWDNFELNNRRYNLRVCTPSQNCANTRKKSTNTSGFKGVSFSKQARRWKGTIMRHGKNKHLGYFDSAEEAAAAYNRAAEDFFGWFARGNELSGNRLEFSDPEKHLEPPKFNSNTAGKRETDIK